MIKQIFYINLDHRIRKKDFMESQLSKVNLPYERIPGVVCDNFRQFPIVPTIKFGSKLHQGTVGCFLAHIKCLKHIRLNYHSNPDDLFCILEDDVIFHPSIFDHPNLNYPYPEDTEILFVNATGFSHRPKADDAHKISDYMYRIPNGGYNITYPYFIGAFFYVLSFKVIEKILSAYSKIQNYYDYDAFLYESCTCYTLVTNQVDIVNFKSDRDIEAHFNAHKFEG